MPATTLIHEVSMADLVCGVSSSALGQKWVWRELKGNVTPRGVIDRILLSRGCTQDDLADYKDPKVKNFISDPSIIKDVDLSTDRIVKAILSKEHITVFGDYDVDGATSSALLVDLFNRLSVKADCYIPDRVLEGYGPSVKAMEKIAGNGTTLIITVDCGAQSYDALKRAKELGVDVIVVDHHQCLETLPEAYAVVNPNRLDEEEGAAYGHLAAVGVAFLLAISIVRALRKEDYFKDIKEPDLIELLDLVALGTVADVALLTGLNRAFVTMGLRVMSKRKRLGIDALLSVANVKTAPVVYNLGFTLGPRINAGGRVGKADLGTRLLSSLDKEECISLAKELDQFNIDRKVIEQSVTDEALAMAEKQVDNPVIVVAGKNWHQGVIGIVAGRLKQKYSRPAIVISIDEEGVGKGSGRSITGVDLGGIILAAREKGLLLGGGGHAMAAGLSVEESKIDEFTTLLSDIARQEVETARLNKTLYVDGVLKASDIHLRLVDVLESGGPYGAGWPYPNIVIGPVYVSSMKIVGDKHVATTFMDEEGYTFKSIAFGAKDQSVHQTLLAAGADRPLYVAGRVQKSEWRNFKEAQLLLEDVALI